MRISKIKFIILSAFICVHLWLFSETLEVNIDGTAPYTIIQEAIDASANSDTVLVHPGTYYENIDMNHHNITLCSLEATTGDTTYISSTIIDGNQSGSCIKIYNGESVIVQGFSLINGIGTISGNYRKGGGIYTNISTINMTSCNIFNNYAPIGGGAYFRFSDVTISNVNIYNNSAKYSAGGLGLFGDTNIAFNSSNRCSIYNNYAPSFLDILIQNVDWLSEIILDKVSFQNPDAYYIGALRSDFSLDYLTHENEYIDDDLYIAPWGSDDNSGLSHDDPFQNINHASYFVISDSLNPKTIHLLPGTYTPDNQQFPISLKSHIILQGDSRETTIIDGCGEPDVNITIASYSDNVKIKDLTITNMTNASIKGKKYCGDVYLENLLIENGTGEYTAGIKFSIPDDIYINDLIITNCNSILSSSTYLISTRNTFINNLLSYNNSILLGGIGNGVNAICVANDFVLENSIFCNNYDPIYEEFTNSAGTSTLSIGNSANVDFINSWRIENCLFYENEALQDMDCEGGFTLTASTATEKGYFINNTVVNNKGMRTMFIGGLDTYVYNNVFYNDNSIYGNDDGYELFVPNTFPFMFHSTITFSNNIIKGGYEGFYDDYPAFNEEIWLNDPIDADPMLDSLNTEWPYFPLANSPVIDAGTTQLPDGLILPEFDLAGNPRIYGDTVDLGCYEWSGTETPEEQLAIIKAIMKNYPNPFNPETNISLNITEPGRVLLDIYNIKGQKVKSLIDARMETGSINLTWSGKDDDGKPVSSGTYIAKCSVNGKVISTKKMTFLK